MFYLPFKRVAGGIFKIANIVPSLVKQLNTKWQAINLQCACCSHENIILNGENKSYQHPRFKEIIYKIFASTNKQEPILLICYQHRDKRKKQSSPVAACICVVPLSMAFRWFTNRPMSMRNTSFIMRGRNT